MWRISWDELTKLNDTSEGILRNHFFSKWKTQYSRNHRKNLGNCETNELVITSYHWILI